MLTRIHQWLGKHFIPHEGNDHMPHFLRTASVQFFLFALFGVQALFLVYTFVLLPSSAHFAAIFASVLVEDTNSERAKQGVAALHTNPLLEKSAQAKADDMATRGYFSHYTPEGDAPWKFIREAGYSYRTAGENLAVNFVDSHDVTEAWMNSPTHRANLLAGKYTEVGVATAHGTYKGKEAIFVVQHFGTPSDSAFSMSRTNKPTAAVAAAKPASDTLVGITSNTTSTASTVIPVVVAKEKSPTAVLGITIDEKPSFWAKFITEPRHMTTLVQLGIAALALLSLLLAFFIRIRIQHPIILANGVMLVAISVTLALVNILLSRGVI